MRCVSWVQNYSGQRNTLVKRNTYSLEMRRNSWFPLNEYTLANGHSLHCLNVRFQNPRHTRTQLKKEKSILSGMKKKFFFQSDKNARTKCFPCNKKGKILLTGILERRKLLQSWLRTNHQQTVTYRSFPFFS